MPVNPPLNAFLASANVFCRLKRATTVLLLCASTSVLATAQQSVGGSRSAQARIAARIDQGSLIKLTGNVRVDLTPNKDLGAVEGSKPLRLALILKRTDAQQADLDSLIAQQQTPGSPNFHKWLTPQQFGERFGAAASDIAKINQWLQSQGFEVKSVLNNGTMIDFAATAGGVRNTFKTELHYYNFPDGKEMANTTAPQVPAALGNVVANISGLAPMHARAPHEVRNVSYNAQTRKWNNSPAPATSLAVTPKPAFDGPVGGGGNYNVTPQDEYTIFDVNPTFSAGNLGQTATVGVAEPFDMAYGTVNPTTGQASGGLVNTFRTLFGVPGTLNMVVMHGAGTVTCNDPGTSTGGNDGEMSLDAEWANALAPSAKLLYMSCDTGGAFGNGGIQAIAALIDNSLSDTITVSYDFNESPTQNYAAIDQLYQQAATQGQSIFISSGDAGDDNGGFTGTPSLARDGLIIGFLAASPLVTAAGGTDFQDQYDADKGGLPQSTYWSATNSPYYGSAKGYIPETSWNDSCGSSLMANDYGNTTPLAYCASQSAADVSGGGGGGGGTSIHYPQPAYQAGIPGLSSSVTMRAIPDISLFASDGGWGHLLVLCDTAHPCTSPSTFGGEGGTSFTAPQLSGVFALLVTATGSRQGSLNPALYALAKAQYTNPATATACFANGQTSNAGVTTSLPASSCVFHDVTTSSNDEPCAAGGTDCYTSTGASYGLLSTMGAASFNPAFNAGVGYDLSTGLGSIDVTNLIKAWNQAFTSSTALSANPTSITTSQTTSLSATVTGGQPTGATGIVPVVTGTVSFSAGSTALGSCNLANATCSITVAATALQPGANSIIANYSGSGTYPSSVSPAATVTTSGGAVAPTLSFTIPTHHTQDAPFIVSAASNSPGAISYSLVSGPAAISGSTVTLTGTGGTVTIQASQAASGNFTSATKNASFTVLAGSVWIGDGNSALSEIDLTGAAISTSAGYTNGGVGTIKAPLGIAFDASGDAWVASSAGVSEFNGQGAAMTPSAITAGGISAPTSVAIDGNSNVLVTNSNGVVSVLSKTGAAISTTAGSTTSAPSSIAIDRSGNVWIANPTANTVDKIIGGAAPVAPLANAVQNNTPGVKP